MKVFFFFCMEDIAFSLIRRREREREKREEKRREEKRREEKRR